MCDNSYLTNEVFFNAAGAAAGGFVGVLLLLIIKWIVEMVGSRPKVIPIGTNPERVASSSFTSRFNPFRVVTLFIR
jgi:hypothetical protein